MNNAQIKENIKKYLEDNKESIISDLITLCKIPSVSEEGKDGYVFGKSVNDALYEVKNIASRFDFEVDVKEKLGYATLSLEKGEKSMGLYSHCDVVPVKADEWIKTSPYEPFIDSDGYMYARGCEDNKSSAIALIYIADMIKKGIIPFESSYLAYFGGSEETGMQDLQNYVANEKMPDLCLVPDNSYPVCVGEKGIMRFIARPKCNFEQIKTFDGGIAVNAVIGTHISEISADEALFEEIKEKISGNSSFDVKYENGIITLTSYGKSSHAAMPEGSQNAAVMAAELLCGCENLSANDKKILSDLAELSVDYYGSAVGILAEDEHFGKNTYVLGISSCRQSRGFFKYDIRYGMTIPSDKMIENIEKAFEEKGFETEIDENCPCFVTGAPRKYIDAVLKVYAEETGISDAKEYYSGGGTYARYLGNSFGMSIHDYSKLEYPVCDLPQGHGEAHQPDEKIYIDAFFKGIVTDCMMMVELDRLLNEK